MLIVGPILFHHVGCSSLNIKPVNESFPSELQSLATNMNVAVCGLFSSTVREASMTQ